LYFRDLDGHEAKDVYNMVISEVEYPLLVAVMKFARGNQSKASEILGINRSTLRKKLMKFGLNN
jgi:Fis family transcriptional regulator